MKILEVCFQNGHGFRAHFKDHEKALETYENIINAIQMSIEDPDLEPIVFFDADDVKGIITLVDFSFVSFMDVESNMVAQEEAQAMYEIPQSVN